MQGGAEDIVGSSTGMQRFGVAWLLNGARGGAQGEKRNTCVSKSSVHDVRPLPRLLRLCLFVRLLRRIEQVRVIAKLYRCRDDLTRDSGSAGRLGRDRGFSQNDETAGILNQLKDEINANLTVFKKKGLDRKTNHHDLTKIETKDMFVSSKAIQEKETLALKLEQSAQETVEVAKAVEAQEKADALPRQARPAPWRDKKADQASCCRTERSSSTGGRRGTNRGNRGSMLWLASSYLEHEATIQEGVKKYHLCLSIPINSL